MMLGIDASALLETRKAKGKYYVNGNEIEPLSYLHDRNGVSILRLRLWVDPYDENGKPYGGGTSDLPSFLTLAKEGLSKGYRILLDYHFSDFWCDPSKQMTPKAWRGQNLEELCVTLKNYIRDTLDAIKEEGISIYAVQIGNEITNGMLWPIGKLEAKGEGEKRSGYDNLTALLRAASTSVREYLPDAKIVIHLERSFDQAIYSEFFDEMKEKGVDFDIIGMSYYPYWHGSFDMLFANIELMKRNYHKPIWIVETSYGFTLEPAYEEEDGKGIVDENALEKDGVRQPYPITQTGQKDFLTNLLALSRRHAVDAIFYWEPLWLPMPGLTWASKAGQNYIKEFRAEHNEWGSQCLFDYKGEATEGLFAYSVKE